MKQMSLSIFRCATVLLALACASHVGDAQVLYGSLTGNVTDPSSAAVPGAKVTALNTDTGISREATTDERGSYLFANAQSGTYRITATAPSFQTMAQTEVRVNANEVRRVDFSLKIAQTSETVEVSTSANILQTDKADVHSEISAQQVVELPYSGGEGKNFQSLLYLVPGAGIPASREANSEAGNPQRAQTLFMNSMAPQSPIRGCR
jgi:hypothetical protein